MAEKLESRVSMDAGEGDGDRELEEEGTSNPAKDFSVSSSPSNCEPVIVNGFSIATDSDPCEGNSFAAAKVRTYKRRKQWKKSSPDSKHREYDRKEVAATVQFENQTSKELVDGALDGSVSERAHIAPTSHGVVANGCTDGSHRQWSRFILEQMYQSLGDDHGVQWCMGHALAHVTEINKVKIKEPEFCAEVKPEHSAQAGSELMHNGDALGVASKSSLDQSDQPTINQMCHHALYDIITSGKFNLLCKLLVQNFEGTKVDRLLDFSIINARMNEGIYESSPALFSSDTKQVWGKLQDIGTELVSLASSLRGITRISCHEHLGKLAQTSSGGGNCEVNGGGNLQFDAKWKQAENRAFYNICTRGHCGEKADGQKCLVCDSCEEMLHASCIQPSVEETPPINWCCTSCIANGIRSAHENCAVCKKLKASRSAIVDQNGNFTNGEVLSNAKNGSCKVCGSGFSADDKIRECEHSYCPNKFYHERCFSANQLQSYGTRWLCPSCLCRSCFTDLDDDQIILCDGCDDAYHMYCLKPPLDEVPPDKWFCRKCEVGIQAILRVKMTYEVVKKKRGRKKKDKTVVTAKKNEEVAEASDKGRGMDMLLTAAKTLNYEENLAAEA